jgi:hypothetical protein
MKKYIHKKAVILTLAIIAIVGCTKFVDGIDDFKIGVVSEIFEQSAVIELKDYFGNHEDITNTDFTVEFSGADADKLVNEAGEYVISETDGFIQLNVNPNKSTGVKELNFDVTISGGNYRTETFPVKLIDTTSHVRLSLVDESKIYKGTSTATKTVGLTNNASSTTVIIKTDKTTSLNKSTVTIKTGTQFKDSAGNALTGADINVEVTNTDGASQTLKDTSDLTFKDINDVVITSKTAQFIVGSTSIKMKMGGTAVKSFNNPIAVAIEIPSDATNPITSEPVRLGDNFPIYTSEENSTAWVYHGTGKVVAGDTTDTFNITFETTHLSKYGVVDFKDLDCGGIDKTYNLTASNFPADFSGFLEVQLIRKNQWIPYYDGVYPIFSVWIKKGKMVWWKAHLSKSNPISLKYSYEDHYGSISGIINSGLDIYRDGPDIKEQLVVKMNGVVVKGNISDIATVANCELSINFNRNLIPNIENLKTINIDVASSCNGNVFVPDGFPFYVLRENGQFSYEGTIKNGKMTLNGFELGKEYIFKTVYKGVPLFRKWTFDSENFIDHNFEISQAACDALGIN